MIKSHQSRLDSFEADKKSMEKDLKALKDSSIPIGFLYIEISVIASTVVAITAMD